MTDHEIVEGIQKGNDYALSFLYRQHYKMIVHFLQNNNGTEDDAKEVYQEAIIHFYEQVQAGLLQLNCKISTYLYAVCRRIWLRKLAHKRRFVTAVRDTEIVVLPIEGKDEVLPEEQFQAMFTAMNKLGEPCRGIMEDYYLLGKSMAEIAEQFGYTNADNAKNQKYKCLQRLKKLFFESYRAKDTL